MTDGKPLFLPALHKRKEPRNEVLDNCRRNLVLPGPGNRLRAWASTPTTIAGRSESQGPCENCNLDYRAGSVLNRPAPGVMPAENVSRARVPAGQAVDPAPHYVRAAQSERSVPMVRIHNIATCGETALYSRRPGPGEACR